MDLTISLERLRATPHRELEAIARETGLGLQTLRAIKYGRSGPEGRRATNPRIDTVQKLARYFGRRDQKTQKR